MAFVCAVFAAAATAAVAKIYFSINLQSAHGPSYLSSFRNNFAYKFSKTITIKLYWHLDDRRPMFKSIFVVLATEE